MGLSNKTIADFVKLVNSNNTQSTPKEATVTATVLELDGRTYVKVDGSDLLTPVSKTTSVKEGDKVTVLVKNHTATVTGNLSDPAASISKVDKQGSKITELEIVMAYKVTTDDLEAVNASIENLKATAARLEDATIVNAQIENLEATFAELDHITATDIEVITAQIESIEAEFANIENISAEDLEAVNAEITNLKGYTADFTYVTADVLEAMEASIKMLEAEKLSVEDAEITYANIEFTNITKAAMEYFYANSGLIQDVNCEGITISGQLVGVSIKGDLIEGGTVKADKLVILGDNGLYYKLNMSAYDAITYQVNYNATDDIYETTSTVLEDVEGTLVENAITTDGDPVYSFADDSGNTIFYTINLVYDGEKVNVTQIPTDNIDGKVIAAKSISADKVLITDLVAFGATIGGFKITDSSIHSINKESVDSSIQGAYLDKEGQIAFGDGRNYLKFYKDENNNYRLTLSAESIQFGAGKDFTLNDDGMTIEGTSDNRNVKIKTNISNNGMRVYANDDEKLKADDDGVEAVDLHAKTYLIISGKSRFEKYGDNRTGCFWIGGAS